MEKKYLVYKHTNKTNKKVYIGISSKRDPEERWRKGYGYKSNKAFWGAIEKYGWDGFDHEVLMTGLTEEEAKAAEKELIAKHKSNCARYQNPSYGYNLTDGGDSGGGDILKKAILQYDLNGNLIREWDSTRAASEETGIDNNTISQNLAGKTRRAGEFMWRFKKESNENKITDYWTLSGFKNPNIPKAKKIEKKICQYDINGKLIKVWETMQEAADALHISSSGISSVASEKNCSYHGFVWRSVEGIPEEKIEVCLNRCVKAVDQYDKENNFIQSWGSISEAGKTLNINISHITQVCKNKRKSAGGYVWRYAV